MVLLVILVEIERNLTVGGDLGGDGRVNGPEVADIGVSDTLAAQRLELADGSALTRNELVLNLIAVARVDHEDAVLVGPIHHGIGAQSRTGSDLSIQRTRYTGKRVLAADSRDVANLGILAATCHGYGESRHSSVKKDLFHIETTYK